MSFELEFRLNGLPRRTNNSNMHWRYRHKESRKWKNAVFFECTHYLLKKRLEAPRLVKAHLTLTRHSGVPPDYDGLVSGFKHVIDGLIDAEIISDDSMAVIGVPEYLWIYAPKNKGFITVRVSSLPSALKQSS